VFGKVYVTYDRPENLFQGEDGDPFPFKWSEEVYCGRIEFPPESPKFTPSKVAIRIPGIRR
jgi:hypothetical protein